MYIGHYGIALAAKKAAPIPLWLLFLAVQLPDIIAFCLVILGVERIAYVGGDNPFYRTAIEYVPYSHSLVLNLVYAGLTLVLFWKLAGRTWGLVLSLLVLSHWFIDFVFQKANMPLWLDSFPVGLGLWDYPVFSFAAEILFVVVGAWLVLRDARSGMNPRLLVATIVLMCAFFAFVTLGHAPPAIAASPQLMGIMVLVPYLLFTLLAAFIDRRRERAAGST